MCAAEYAPKSPGVDLSFTSMASPVGIALRDSMMADPSVPGKGRIDCLSFPCTKGEIICEFCYPNYICNYKINRCGIVTVKVNIRHIVEKWKIPFN